MLFRYCGTVLRKVSLEKDIRHTVCCQKEIGLNMLIHTLTNSLVAHTLNADFVLYSALTLTC